MCVFFFVDKSAGTAMCLLFYSKGWKKKHGTYRIAAACGRPVYGCLRRIGLQGPRDAQDQLQKLRHLRRLVRRLQFVFPILLLSFVGLGCCEAIEPLCVCHKRILRFLPQITRWCPDFSYGTPLRSAVPQTDIKKAYLWNILLSHRYALPAFCCRLLGGPAPRPFGHRLLSLYC